MIEAIFIGVAFLFAAGLAAIIAGMGFQIWRDIWRGE